MGKQLTEYAVLTFDCYGTLIDWETGIWKALQPLLLTNRRNDVARDTALATFAKIESKHQSENPLELYSDILRNVHMAFADQFDLQTSSSLNDDFGNSVARWPAFPDSADALRYLASRFKLVILSNIDRSSFAASNRKLGVEFDAVYTAEDVGAYKPSPANFEYLLEHLQNDLGIHKSEILHTAQSLFHDHVPARAFGLANAWIDRQHLSASGSWGATAKVDKPPTVDFTFYSMQEMADAVAADSTL